MPQIINTNVMSINSQKNLNRSQSALKTSLNRLSSGLRINSAKDDAAGLAISERFTAQVRGLSVAMRNANDGISLSQVAEGALEEASNILQRVRELAVQSVNATNSPSDRKALQLEVGQLTAELNRIAKSTEFNGQKILDGTFGTALFQIGANPNQMIVASTGNFKTNRYGDYRIYGMHNTVSATTANTTTPVESNLVDRLNNAGASLKITGPEGTQSFNYAATDTLVNIVDQVNQLSDKTGVTAWAKTDMELTFSSTGTYQFQLAADNSVASAVTISFDLSSITGAEALSAAVQAVNDYQAKTGVVATVNDQATGIVLTHFTGENITLLETSYLNSGNVVAVGGPPTGYPNPTIGVTQVTMTGNADTTISQITATGQIVFDADKSFSVVDAGTVNTQSYQLLSASGAASTLMKVADLDVSSVSGGNLAMYITDAALAQVSGQRARFGALQSRFESTIRNLETSVENMTGARSRIRDADFAVETAELTRSQILQQAGIAMLAQANTIPQNVLSLLQ